MFKKRTTPTGLGSLQNGLTGQRPLRLRRVHHSDEIVSGFSKLLKNESMTDVTLICNGGQTIRAHRVILSTFSPYFRSIFEAQPFSSNPCQFPVIVVKDLGLAELRAIVEFIYRGEVSVPRDKLPAILQAAKALEVSGLADLKAENFGVSSLDQDSTELAAGSSLASLAALESVGKQRLIADNGSESNTADQLKKLKLSLDNGTSTGFEHLLDTSGSDFGTVGTLDPSMRSLLQNQIGPGTSASGLKAAQLSQLNQQFNLAKQHKQLAQMMHRQQLAALKQQMLQQQLLKNAANSGAGSPSPGHSSAGRQSPATRTLASLNGLATTAALQAKMKEKQQQLQHHKLLQERLMQKSILNKHLRPIQEMHISDPDDTNTNGKSSNEDQNDGNRSSPKMNGDLNDSAEVDIDCDPPIPVETRLEEHEPLDSSGETCDDNADDATSSNNQQKINGIKSEKDLDSSAERRTDKSSESSKEENGESNAVAGSSNETGNGEDQIALLDDEELMQVSGDATGTGDEEDYEMDIDKDHVFQRQQQLRLLQLQKQQQYQAQLQMQLQIEEQEQKLMDFNQLNQLQQQLQAVAAAAGLQTGNGSNGGSGNGSSATSGGDGLGNSTNADDQDDTSFGFDWQEGFMDSGYSTCANNGSVTAGSASSSLSGSNGLQFNNDSPFSAKLSLLALGNSSNNNGNQMFHGNGSSGANGSTKSAGNGGSNGNNRDSAQSNGNSSTSNGTPRQTPDFLQPRGPGRPRKGNKAQDISPCPQCHKIFVRPDVLKLHYRSVHLNERHPCNICPKIFKWPGDLSKHKRTKHPQEMAALAAAAAAQASARQMAVSLD